MSAASPVPSSIGTIWRATCCFRQRRQVTRHNFKAVLPRLKAALQQCSFVSLDCEFSGMSSRKRDGSAYHDALDTRYGEWSDAARRYTVLQVGLSAFLPTPQGLQATVFNFWLHPRAATHSEFWGQAATLAFLAKHGFDFNRCFNEGIPHMSPKPQMLEHNPAAQPSEQEEQCDAATGAVLPQVPSATSEDHLSSDLALRIKSWLNGVHVRLNLPDVPVPGPGSPFWQTIRLLQRDPNGQRCYVYTLQKPIGTASYVQLTKTRVPGQQKLDVEGFTEVLKAIKESCKPAVVHNGIYDLAFLLHHCGHPLPKHWHEFKGMAQYWFPGGMWDTKVILRSFKHLQHRDTSAFPRTQLFHVYKCITQVSDFPAMRYSKQVCIHEAGFDSYMTGIVFANLAHLAAMRHAAHVRQPTPASRSHPTGQQQQGSHATGGSFWSRARAWLFGTRQQSASQHTAGTASTHASPVVLEHLQEYRGLINVSYSRTPYANMEGADPTVTRDNIFHLITVPGLHRLTLEHMAKASLGLGRPLTHWKNKCTHEQVGLSFPYRTPQAWAEQCAAMVTRHAGRLPPGTLTNDQQADPR
ncbi:hypothetical protein WJX73_008348 [Symbiochloris irregularis]|uniref:Uncharacterized protein n=1 Tax=Symbiochloris irregularis TaxID=706552 RepID=A0AAW1NT69_9CHLO